MISHGIHPHPTFRKDRLPLAGIEPKISQRGQNFVIEGVKDDVEQTLQHRHSDSAVLTVLPDQFRKLWLSRTRWLSRVGRRVNDVICIAAYLCLTITVHPWFINDQ